MGSISTDNRAALEFLRLYEPEGPWVLTCISTDRKGIDSQSFTPKQIPKLERWLEDYNGERNIYFHVNSTLGGSFRKARRENVKALDFLHVDIDPRAGEDIASEQSRCLGLLTDKLPEGVPEPTFVIFSGGGYQGFWRLEEPVPIDGDLDRAEDAKLYNMQLELLFGADNCHNIDRIMRLPGTINLPDARKKKKGRVPVLATLHSHNEVAYPIETFTKAAEVQGPDESGFTETKPKVEIGGEVERVMDLDELDKWSVPNRVKIIIAQGSHPDEPKEGDNSRSAWLFDACCNLARCEVPENIIYSLITDPEWGISESVIELKGNTAHKYAVRTITRAMEHAKDPALEELNGQFAVIETLGGKCRIIEEVIDPALDRPRLTIQSFQDFTNRYSHRTIQVGVTAEGIPKYMPLGKWWLTNPSRRQFHTVTFAPGKDVGRSYNLWKGFACEARPGDCSLFLAHIRDNICSGSEEHFDYTMGWLARMIQNPATPGEVALVLRGGRGTGKSFFATQLGKLLGRHFLHVSNSSHLTGNFNSHLRDLVLLFADEAFFAGDKKHASILKTLITESTLTIERKGVDVENAPNFIHLIMASNDKHVVPAGEMERRFFVLDVGVEHQQDTSYFRAMATELDNGGREALLHHLREYDLSEFNVRQVPQTRALQHQKLLSLTPEAEWWYQKLCAGQLLWGRDGWPEQVVSEHLVNDFVDHAKRFNVLHRGSETALGLFFNTHWPFLRRARISVEVEKQMADGFTRKSTMRLPHHIVPPLEECRAVWTQIYGELEWPDMEDQGVLKAPPNDPPF